MKTFFFFSLLAWSLNVAGQDSIQIANLAGVTVTATRTEQKILTTPRSVTVITADDIRKQPYQNLADLLQKHEGIFIPGTFQNPGSLQTLFLRGADNKQTLVMIDGVRLTDASTPDNGLDFNEISLNSIERIEIVRGSQGTLYGGSAVGGVINIITKKNDKPGPGGNLKVSAGSFGKNTFVSNVQAGIGYRSNGFFGRMETIQTNSNGFNNSVQRPNTFFINEKDDFRKNDFAAKVGYDKKGWEIYTGYRRVDQKADIDDGAFNDDENNILKYKRNLYTYGLTRKINDKASAKFFGGYTNTERNAFDDSSIISLSPLAYDRNINDATYTGKNLTNEAQLNYKNNHWKLVGGVGHINDRMNTNSTFTSYAFNFTSKTNYDTVGIKMATTFAYVHAGYEVPLKNDNRLNIAGGARYSYNDHFGNFVSYEFTPDFQLNKNTSLFAAYSTGYNSPSLYQMFAPETDFTSNISRGYAELKPEESNSTEVGLKTIIKQKIGVRLSLYQNIVRNYIDYVYLWNNSKPITGLDFSDFRGDTYLNTGKQINRGFEVGLDIHFSDKWQLNSNVSYNDGELQYDPSFINVNKTKGNHVQLYGNGAFLTNEVQSSGLIRRPQSIANTSLVFKPTKLLRLTADARFVGARNDVYYNPVLGPFGALDKEKTTGFALYNLSANWQFHPYVSACASIFNVFNKKYIELNGFNTRGRSAFATIHFEF